MTITVKHNRLLNLSGGTLAMLLIAGLPAVAHPGHLPMSGFAAGIQHPSSGMDHLLAMIAVGLWAGLSGGYRAWLWPATFVASMIAGSVIGMFGAPNLPVEPAIMASVMALGLATALRLRAPAVLGGLAIAAFGVAHGYAHGIEMPHTAHGLDFAAGFALATATLHLVGVVAATSFRRLRLDHVTRFAGVGIAIAGFSLITGA